jgi:hypothetical protein
MNQTVHDIGLDVHKETIAVAIAPAGDTEVGNYGGSLEVEPLFLFFWCGALMFIPIIPSQPGFSLTSALCALNRSVR